MRRVYKNLCHATISASIMAANMWKNSLKNVESDNNKILYETLFYSFLQRNGTYFLYKPRTSKQFSRSSPVPRSADPNPLDFYLCLHLQPLVNSVPIENEDSIQRIFDACKTIRIHLGDISNGAIFHSLKIWNILL